MEIWVPDVKRYCRIDGDEEDGLLADLIDAAKGYLAGAGIDDPATDDRRYALAVMALVLHYYDYRGLTEAPAPSAIPGIRNLINQLKLEAEASRVMAEEAASCGS